MNPLNKPFRSRGIKVNFCCPYEFKMKEYYEPENNTYELNNEISELSKRFECFEYSLNDGNIDSVNFHTRCQDISDIINPFNSELIENIADIFDETYRPYTLGYRLNGGKSIYYYPTIWKGDRYGIRGITDIDLIESQICRFLDFIQAAEVTRDFIRQLINGIIKFKGICVTNYCGENTYKLYLRMNENGIYENFNDYVKVNELENQYGDIVLMSIGFNGVDAISTNFYFVR